MEDACIVIILNLLFTIQYTCTCTCTCSAVHTVHLTIIIMEFIQTHVSKTTDNSSQYFLLFL